MVRFGDGEVRLMNEISIPFQKSSPLLAKRLRQVLSDCSEGLIQGIPALFPSFNATDNIDAITFSRGFFGKYHEFIVSHLNKSRTYYDVGLTYQYINHGSVDVSPLKDYFQKFISIWEGKDIVVICGNRVFNHIDYNIFDSASNVQYLWAPTCNAFDEYDKILEQAKKIPKDKLIVIILGPTATILGYDLFKLGYRALDLGHLAKDYDAYKKQLKSTDENIFKFFAKE